MKAITKKQKALIKVICLTLILGLIIGFGIGIGLNKEIIRRTNTICYDMADLNETLSTIEENCGSTFITKRYGDDNWFIFRGMVCDGKTCGTEYTPIDKCVSSEVSE